MSATAEEVTERVRGAGVVTRIGADVKAIESNGIKYDEVVKIRVLYAGNGSSKGKLLRVEEGVWARRREVAEGGGQVIKFDFYGKYDYNNNKHKRLQFIGEDHIGKGTLIEDAAGNVYAVTRGSAGRKGLAVALVKAAGD